MISQKILIPYTATTAFFLSFLNSIQGGWGSFFSLWLWSAVLINWFIYQFFPLSIYQDDLHEAKTLLMTSNHHVESELAKVSSYPYQ